MTLDSVSCSDNVVLRSGGCVFGYVATISVRNSTFARNHGGADVAFTAPRPIGGAIGLYTTGGLTIVDSEFRENGLTVYGGAIGAFGGAFISVNNSRFYSNVVNSRGGAIFIDSGPMSVYDSWFESNRATSDGPLAGRGSAIAAASPTEVIPGIETNIVNCTFFKNAHVINYARLEQLAAVSISRRGAWVSQCSFLNNTGLLNSGIYLFAISPVVDSCVFIGNRGQQGAAAYAEGVDTLSVATAVFRHCLFLENYLDPYLANVGAVGAALITQDAAYFEIQNCTFLRNIGVSPGVPNFSRGVAFGLFKSPQEATVNITGSLFQENTFTNTNLSAGFVVSLQHYWPTNAKVYVSDTKFIRNALLVPRAPYLSDSSCGTFFSFVPANALPGDYNPTLEITDSLFEENSARSGAGFCVNDHHLKLARTKFIRNSNAAFVGTVAIITGIVSSDAVTDYRMNVEIEDCQWVNNTCQDDPLAPKSSTTDLAIACRSNEDRDYLLTMKGPSVFTPSPPGLNRRFDSNIQVSRGVMRLTPASGGSAGDVVDLPSIVTAANVTLDFRQTSTTVRKGVMWFDDPDPSTAPTTVLVGAYDTTFTEDSSLSHVVVVGANQGKFIVEGTPEFIGENQTRILQDVIFVNKGFLTHYNATVELRNAVIVNSPNASYLLPLWPNPTTIASPVSSPKGAFQNFGNLTVSILQLDRVDLTLHNATGSLNYALSNYWEPVGIKLWNGSTITLGGNLTIDSSPMRKYTEPPRGKIFPFVDSTTTGNSIAGAVERVLFQGGYTYSLQTVWSPSNFTLAVNGFAPLAAQLSDGGASVSVSFPRAMNVASVACADLLSASTISALHPSARCTWSDASTLVIRSSRFPRTLSFLPGRVVDVLDAQFTFNQLLDVQVTFPATPLAPSVILSGPSAVPLCSDITIDARGTSPFGNPAAATYHWDMIGNSDLTTLLLFVRASGGPVLSMAASLLASGERNFTFCLNVSNSFAQSSSDCVSVSRQAKVVPLVSIEGPTERSPAAIDSLSINGRVDVPSCIASPAAVQRQWVRILGPPPRKPPVGLDQFTLFFPSDSLDASATYIYEFRAWITADAVASQTVTIRPRPSNIIIVSAGAAGLVPQAANLNMSIAVLDPNQGFSRLGGMTATWELLNCPGRASDGQISAAALAASFLTRSENIKLINRPDTFQVNTTSYNTTTSVLCRDATKSTRIAQGTGSFYMLNGTEAPLGEFLFGVTAYAPDNRTASAIISLTVSGAPSYSLVQFQSSQLAQRKVLPQEKLTLSALVDGAGALPAGSVIHWRDERAVPGILDPRSTICSSLAPKPP